ncbi:MAG: hypothetical protein ABIT38_18960, partial [Gemmatimonadaceae bacterium]
MTTVLRLHPITSFVKAATTLRRKGTRGRALVERRARSLRKLSLACLTLAGACARSTNAVRDDTSTAAGETASAKSVKDMPGMDMPKTAQDSDANAAKSKDDSSTITFTAAQVRNGKVRWEGVTVGTAQATMILPGQVVPNEDRTARLGSPVAGRVLSVHVSP